MTKLITYADERMSTSAALCIQSGIVYCNAQAATLWTPERLIGWFDVMASHILKHQRGAGYWLWKPFIILQELERLIENEILIYSDAGIEFIAPLNIAPGDKDILLFDNGWPHVQWCKMDILNAILPGFHDPNPVRFESKFTQVQASVIILRNTPQIRAFVKEWLLWCLIPGFVDDSPGKLPNHPTFSENRHDQAILSTLAFKYGFEKHWWPSTVWVNEKWRYPNDKYPALFNHHRKRNNEW